MNIKKTNSLIISFFLASCSTIGPSIKTKSPLNYLNGEHYKATMIVAGIPVAVKGVKKDTLIQGRCFFNLGHEDNFKYPVKFKRIGIYKDTKLLRETNTNTHGIFDLKFFLPNGNYLIKILSKHYTGEIPIKISSYNVEGVNLLVKKIIKKERL